MTAFEVISSLPEASHGPNNISPTTIADGGESSSQLPSPPMIAKDLRLTNPQIQQGSSNQPDNAQISHVVVAGNGKNTVKVGFYEVEKTIGKGNYAVVKLARHRITKTEVAIKIIDKRRLNSENLAKIYREVEVLKKISHPNIIKLYQVMETMNMIYLVTEYAPNGEIFDLILKHRRLGEESAREKFWQIISAVDYLHQLQIVHRDLKAENLLLDAINSIKLADFGFSNFYSRDETLNTFCGSPPYAAPEVFEGKCYRGPEIDVWSLGVCLYVLVCGVLPFEGANLQLLRDRVLSGRIRIPYFMSGDCENLIRRMLTLEPLKRPTIEQIRHHSWMNPAKISNKIQAAQAASVTLGSSVFPSLSEPHPQIIKLMTNLGIEATKIRNAILTDAYDNFHAIYLLLLERLKASSTGSMSPPASASVVSSLPAASVQQQQSSLLSQNPQPISSPSTMLSAPEATQQQLKSRAKIRRQSDGLSAVGTVALQYGACCCCCASCAFKQQTNISGASTTSAEPMHQQQQHRPTENNIECNNIAVIQAALTAGQYSHSDYEENCTGSTTLSRQSTIGTIGSCSIDEGVECSDAISQSGSELGVMMPFENFVDCSPEADMFSSVCSSNSSQSPNINGSTSTHSVTTGICCCRAGGGIILNNKFAASGHSQTRPRHHNYHLHHHHNHGGTSPSSAKGEDCAQGLACAAANPLPQLLNFGDGWRASDNSLNAIGGHAAGEFPTGQLGKRIRAIHEINRCGDQTACFTVAGGKAASHHQPVHAQLRRMRISPISISSKSSSSHHHHSPTASAVSSSANSGGGNCPRPKYLPMSYLPKRISLPENLAFKPQMLLSLKQSMQVEQQLVEGGTGASSGKIVPMDAKQALKQRLLLQQQQRMNKSRMHMLVRQQSYQAQKQANSSFASSIQNATQSPAATGLAAAASKQHGQPDSSSHPLHVLHLGSSNNTDHLSPPESDNGANKQHLNTPLSPIEDLKSDEMDTF